MPEARAPRPEPQQPYLRHFVFQPGPPERNNTIYYAVSFVVFVLTALALEAGVDWGLSTLALDNKALAHVVAALRDNVDRVPWRWLFLFFAISYLIIWIALGIAVKLVHRRKVLTLYTDRAQFDTRRAILGFVLYAAIMVVPFLFYIVTGHSQLKANFHAGPFAELLALSCLLLIVQTSTEEALFRGYLTQFVATVTDFARHHRLDALVAFHARAFRQSGGHARAGDFAVLFRLRRVHGAHCIARTRA